MIYIDVSLSEFRDTFRIWGRSDSFTYEALEHIYDDLMECGQDVELDVIAICCDYSQDTLKNVLKEYDLDSFEDLERETWALRMSDDTVLYRNF